MSDQIKGIAVLDDRTPQTQLICCCVGDPNAGRETHVSIIPIRPRGTPKGLPEEWEYDIVNEITLHVTPSLQLSANFPVVGREAEWPAVFNNVELFHNDGSWHITFVRWSTLSPEEIKDFEHPWEYHRKINAEFFKPIS